MIAVAGTMLFVIPEPDSDPVAAVYALEANTDPEAPSAETEAQDEAPTSTYEVSDSSQSNDVASWLAAMSGSEAAAELSVVNFARRATTTEAPTTTEQATTTAAPTTAAPTTPTAPPTAAETTAASTDDTQSTESADESAQTAETTDSTDATEQTESTETTEAPSTSEAPTTTTTAPPTTAADNGFVDAGHGVAVPPILLKIRWCESRDDYTAANPSSSARGAYQFLTGSWAAYGHAARYGVSRAHLASPAQQDEAALITWERDGTRPWLASKHCWG